MASGRAHFDVVDSAVRGLSKVQTYIEHGMNDIIEVSLDLAENGADEGSLRELETVMKEYVHLNNDLHQYNQAVKAVTQQMKQQDPKSDFDVDGELQCQLENIANGESQQNVENHAKMVELREKLWHLQHPGEEMGSQLVPVDAANNSDDDEPTMTQVEVSTRCPISQAEMADPVKNKICGHNYEKKAVAEIMRQRRGAKCPVTGCHNKQSLAQKDLVENRELKSYIERRNRQAGKKGN